MDTTEATESLQSIVDQITNAPASVLLKAAATLAVGIILVQLFTRLLTKVLGRSGKMPLPLQSAIRNGLRIILYILVILTTANMLGISTTSFVAMLSVLTLAVSLAIQGILSNVVGGIIIMMNDPFKIGDFVEYDTMIGTIQNIQLMQTTLLSPDGRTIYIPNSVMYSSKLINYNKYGIRRIELVINASYESTPEKVRQAIRQAVDACGDLVLPEPEMRIFLDQYQDSSIRYLIWIWTQSADFLNVKYTVNEELYRTFAQNGIKMTYPHLNVHLDTPPVL